MKSFTMKALALAVLGLAGVGTAMATCPTATIASNGNVTFAPWSGGKAIPAAAPGGTSTATAALFSVTGPGMAGTTCELNVNLGSNGTGAGVAPGNARSFVTYSGDTSDETRIRARFYVDTTNASEGLAANAQSAVFTYSTTNSPAGLSAQAMAIVLAMGAAPRLNFTLLDASGTQITSGNVVLPAYGQNIVEIDLSRDGSACTGNAKNNPANNFRYWVTDTSGVNIAGSPINPSVTADDTHPSGTMCVQGAGWNGAPSWNLGMTTSTASLRGATSAFVLHFDEFDARRQTYIGK